MSNNNTTNNNNRQLLDWAKYYVDHNLTVVPVHTQSKQPSMGNGWQNNVDNVVNIGYLHKDSNIGIMLGEPSGGYVDIDLDCPEALELAPKFLPETATFGRKSAPESHWVYKVTVEQGDLVANYNKAYTSASVGGTIAEFRAKGQTVHPPSVHDETGELIHWNDITGDPLAYINILPASDLYRQFSKLIVTVILQQHIIDGIKHHATLHLIGALWHLGWPIDEVEDFIEHMVEACEMNYRGRFDRLKCIHDTFVKGTEYEQNIGGFNCLADVLNNSGQDGVVIVQFLRKILMPTALGEKRLLTPAEVFSACPKIHEAVDYLAPDSNQSINSPFDDQQAQPAQPALPVQPQLQAIEQTSIAINSPFDTVETITMGPKVIVADTMEIRLLDELARTNNTKFQYLIENLLPANELGFIFGDSGSYKTYLTLDMMLAMAYEDEWAGKRIAPAMGDMLLITGEGRNTIGDRVRVWMQEHKIDAQTPANNELFIFENELDLFDDPRRDILAEDSFSELVQYLQQRPKIRLIVMDTWSSLFSGDENSSKDVAPTLKRLKIIADKMQITLLIVHHKGKSGQSYRGSGALTANSDFNFDISKELDLTENEKPGPDSETTGRIIFEDKQQRSSASNSQMIFKPRVTRVQGRETNFDEPLMNVVMDYMPGSGHVAVRKIRVGIDSLRPQYKEKQIELLKDMVDIFDTEKEAMGEYTTGGLTVEQLLIGIKKRSYKRGGKNLTKQNLSRGLERLKEHGLMDWNYEGNPTIMYYYLPTLVHRDLEKLRLKEINESSVFE